MLKVTKIAVIGTVLATAGAMTYAAKTMENDAAGIDQAKISMTQAVTAAEQHASGKAARAEFEQAKGGAWVFNVEVVSGAKTFDVKVNADNGTVISSVEEKADADSEHADNGNENQESND